MFYDLNTVNLQLLTAKEQRKALDGNKQQRKYDPNRDELPPYHERRRRDR